MPKQKVLSAKDLIRIFHEFGFKTHSQRGSHLRLERISESRQFQRLTIPNHSELDRGTLHEIYKQALRYIPEVDLRPHFYTS